MYAGEDTSISDLLNLKGSLECKLYDSNLGKWADVVPPLDY